MLGVGIVVAALVGVVTGFAGGYLARSGPAPSPAAEEREYYLFTIVQQFDDTLVGQPPDYWAPDKITANKGDTVKIHFYNTEEAATLEHHTFTIDAPYSINHDLPAQTNLTFSFVASTAGIFTFYCSYHQPVMVGTLDVRG